jgi:hypothetical protein
MEIFRVDESAVTASRQRGLLAVNQFTIKKGY